MLKYSITIMLLIVVTLGFAGTTGRISGKITDEAGKKLAFVKVKVDKDGKNVIVKQTTDAGMYNIVNLQPGEYQLEFSLTGYETLIVKGVQVAADKQVIKNQRLKKQSPVGRMGGIIKDSTGKGLAYVNIVLTQGGKKITGTQSKAKGMYTLLNIPAGEYVVEFSLVGFEKNTQKVIITADKQSLVNAVLTKPKGKQESPSAPVLPKNDIVISHALSDMSTENDVSKDMVGSSSMITMDGMTTSDLKSMSVHPNMPPPPPNGNFTTEDYAAVSENPFKYTTAEPLSTFSIDVDTATYSNLRRLIGAKMLPEKSYVRIEELLNYFDYDYPVARDIHPFSVFTEVGTCPWNTKHQLLHIGLQGKEIDLNNAPNSNLVFLLDVSGSMAQPNKLPLVKESMKLLINQLRPEDRVAIVVYAGASGMVLPSTSGRAKQTIVDALERLQAGGTTAGGAGITLAYKVAAENFITGGNNRVILCTDGDFNTGASSDAAMMQLIEEKRKEGVFLTVLGYGMGNIKDNKMEILADKGNGNYAYIDSILEANKVLVKEMGGTLYTIAKDVKLQLEFNPAHVKAYRLIGYENRTLNKEDFNNDRKDAGEIGSGHSVTALYELIPASSEETISGVDPLKYQTTQISEEAKESKEMLTVKLRYKKPDGDTSILMTHTVDAKVVDTARRSENFTWSAAVAEFGLLLRNSEYKGQATWQMVIDTARSAIGKDRDGYRKEFISLAEKARDLMEAKGNTNPNPNPNPEYDKNRIENYK